MNGPPSAADHTRDGADVDLVRRMAAGDPEALRAFYDRHGPALFSFLWGRTGSRCLAEDLLQDVMLAVWRAAPGFRGDSKVQTWVFTIAHHRAANALRRRQVVCAHYSAGVLEGTSVGLPPDAEPEVADLRAAIERLPAGQRAVLELVFARGMTLVEVAEVTGVAPGTVKSRLHRAKRALRRMLAEESTSD